ncbi:hypothetical protein Scep_030943 [Stephania cephalantha]|uniref:Uncharacterized protein n=1 Tax=Stephania cephalantha TaxID=152367 RepID=A0AAP0E413_9MAGN
MAEDEDHHVDHDDQEEEEEVVMRMRSSSDDDDDDDDEQRRMMMKTRRERWLEKKKKQSSSSSSSSGETWRRYCMDLEEVRGCRDLGFQFMDSNSYASTNSPIAAWRISSPAGDDPKEIKARLKIWAHAVALVSSAASRHL